MTVADVSNLYFFIYLPYLTKCTPKLIVHLLFGFMLGLHTCVFIVTFLFNVKGACSQFLKKNAIFPIFFMLTIFNLGISNGPNYQYQVINEIQSSQVFVT